jgi:hypothetical protein
MDQRGVTRHALIHGAAGGNQAIDVSKFDTSRFDGATRGLRSQASGRVSRSGAVSLPYPAGAFDGAGWEVQPAVDFRAGDGWAREGMTGAEERNGPGIVKDSG